MEQCNNYQKLSELGNVSRETFHKLELYHQLLLKWQKKINLVSPTTISNAWERHFFDSVQLFYLLSDEDKTIFDLGSGAGFPGLVLSIMGKSGISLIEVDQKKCSFLFEVIRQTFSNAKIINQRIEKVNFDKKANVITSRACASLNELLNYSYPLLSLNGRCLFLKGKDWEKEIEEAQRKWMFHVKHYPNRVSGDGCVLEINSITPI